MASDIERSGTQAVERALVLLDALTVDRGRTTAADIAATLGIAPSTARRMVATLAARGLIARVGHGRYAGGARLRLLADAIDPHARLAQVARPILRRLARDAGGTAHLGVFADEMMTYLVKEGARAVFTREQEQLEAYCTGIGKAALMQLSDDALAAYLRTPFVRLTPRTLVEPEALRAEIARARREGHAVDDREMADDLACVAVPLAGVAGGPFSLSLSGDPAVFTRDAAPRIAARLHRCAARIHAGMAR